MNAFDVDGHIQNDFESLFNIIGKQVNDSIYDISEPFSIDEISDETLEMSSELSLISWLQMNSIGRIGISFISITWLNVLLRDS